MKRTTLLPLPPDKISSKNMAILFLCFMTGSSIVYIPAPMAGAAGNAAWLSLLAASLIGFLLLAAVFYVRKQFPEQNLFGWSQLLFGRWITLLFAVPYLIYILIMATLILMGASTFVRTSMLNETPIYVIDFLIVMLCAVTIKAGIATFSKMFAFMLFIMLLLSALVLVLAIPQYNPEYLLPIMPDGLMPFWHGVYFAFGFPFAEVLLFALLLPLTATDRRQQLNKYFYTALIVNVISLLCVIIASLMAMGLLTAVFEYSVFQISRLINIEEIVARIEFFVAVSLIAGSYMKASIALFALNLGLSQLLKLDDQRILIYPLAALTYLLTLVMINYSTEFVEKFTIVWPLLNLTVGVIPFLALFLAALVRTTRYSTLPKGD
ncbi:GerAB/ArcD/ProY family transporter [Paenibacillus sp. 1P07SE]|uniref:GerAB/ArcD/ProY family transporter n=1 Tax=Paenibacillus sp. 1P07SE TaxID=3132209 RepID=UPI0039A52509